MLRGQPDCFQPDLPNRGRPVIGRPVFSIARGESADDHAGSGDWKSPARTRVSILDPGRHIPNVTLWIDDPIAPRLICRRQEDAGAGGDRPPDHDVNLFAAEVDRRE
jgi:hypothetical protein